MSDPLIHDLRKLADTGLQLRLPVDLVPPTQYSRLTNAEAIIEGELRTRTGVTFLADLFPIAGILLMGTLNNTIPGVTYMTTITPNGYYNGETVVIDIVDDLSPIGHNIVIPGTYTVTITSLNDDRTFNFTPAVPTTPWAGTDTTDSNVIGKVIGGFFTSLTNISVHTIFRLDEAVASIVGDRLVGAGNRLFRASLPSGNDFFELTTGVTGVQTGVMLSGNPLSIIPFRFTLDTASWAIIADSIGMYKYRPGPGGAIGGTLVPLGNVFPTVQASATAGGAGNLNSTGGVGYDWRYTWVDGNALTESNPSPVMLSPGGKTTTKPTTFTNPANTGDTAFVNPNQAFDGSSATGAVGTIGSDSGDGLKTVSCLWKGWAQPAGSVESITLAIDAQFDIFKDNAGIATVSLQYSFDAGVTWLSLVSGFHSASIPRQVYSATVPTAIPYGSLYVRAIGTAHGLGGGGGSGSVTTVVTVYDISTTQIVDPSDLLLPLVNKIAVVCVTPPSQLNQTFIYLYRRGGSLPDAWRRVGKYSVANLVQGSCGAGTLEIDDNVSDTTLSTSDILQLDNDQPVTSVAVINQPLEAIWGPTPSSARVLGCGDPARPECVYFSKPGNADAWPPNNFVEVSDPGTPIISGCVYNTRTFAYSREKQYELVEGLNPGITFSPFATQSSHGLYTKTGLTVGPMIYFISKDGIYESDGGTDTSIVENDIKPLFPTLDGPGRDVNGYEAIDYASPTAMRLAYHNSELYFLYRGLTTGTRQMLVYDIMKKRWRAGHYITGISCVYSEGNTISSLLLGTDASSIYQAGGNFDTLELDIIENAGIQLSDTAVVTLTAGPYWARMTRLTSEGEVAISPEFGPIAVDASHGILASFPVGPEGTTAWRIYFGTAPNVETQYTEFSEASLVLSRQVVIVDPGTSGTMPTAPPNSNIAVSVRTGAGDQGQPLNRKEYDNVIFDLDPGGATDAFPVTITPYINGEIQSNAAITVTGTGRQQVPLNLEDYFAFNTSYEISWERADVGAGIVSNPIIFQYDTLFRIEPPGLKHFEMRESSFGIPGYLHLRDAYVAIRSNAAVTLTIVFDGTTQTYTVPSTAGQRRKVYVQFQSNKGKVYKMALDSAAEFRAYPEDMEFRVKPFLGLLGYAIVQPFGEALGG